MRRSLFDIQAGEAFGRYELLLPIARGGMSRVWAARLRGTRGFQKLVAIKTLRASTSDDSMLERMLLEEARLASQIQHPNVAQYLDLGERQGVLFVVMEWLEGEALGSLMRLAAPSGGIPLGISVQIVAQVCKGLHGAHELRDAAGAPLGLVHCDVSPQNLMVGKNGAVRLIDFGIARATHDHGSTQLFAGKLAFMAPEQARGESIDRRADLFSLGVVLYLLTTGRHPFPGKTAADSLRRMQSNAPILEPSVIRPSYPKALELVVLKALARDPASRFGSAAEMLMELTEAFPRRASEPAVAEFVERVAGTVLKERREAITEAMRLADERQSKTPLPASEEFAAERSSARQSTAMTSTDAPLETSPRTSERSVSALKRRSALAITLIFLLGAIAAGAALHSGILNRGLFLASQLTREPIGELRDSHAKSPAQTPTRGEPHPTLAAREAAQVPLLASTASSEPLPAPAASVPQCGVNDPSCARAKKPRQPRAACPAGKTCGTKPSPGENTRLLQQRYGI